MKHYEPMGFLGLMLCALARPALAQTAEERAGARAAAEQGVKAYAEGRWADAADLMSRAEKLVHAPTHLLYLAQAEEKLGHLVSAHETYLKIVHEKFARDAPAVFVAAQEEARKNAESLRARLGQVSIVVQGSPPGAQILVTMDDTRVPEALVGVPHPVDPGEHRFEASSDRLRSGLAKVVLREGASETVVLTLQASPAASPAQSATPSEPITTPVVAAPTSPATHPEAPKSSGTHPLKIGGYVGLGVGVVGLGVGTVFALRARGLRSDADALCNGPNGTCPAQDRPRIEDLDSSANTASALAVVGFVTGGIGVAAGITMLLLAPSSSAKANSAFVAPYVAANGAGLWGRF